jgi:uncharacterized C2H2 Zn-finger protein
MGTSILNIRGGHNKHRVVSLKCRICDDVFTRPANLTSHITKKHPGMCASVFGYLEKPLCCSICERAFKRNSDRNRHIKKNALEISGEC